jgi:hypothetical protein
MSVSNFMKIHWVVVRLLHTNNQHGKASGAHLQLFIADLPKGSSLLPCGLYSIGYLEKSGCDVIWGITSEIFWRDLRKPWQTLVSAASLQADIWIQDLPYLKREYLCIPHNVLCDWKISNFVPSAVQCHYMAISVVPKEKTQLKRMCHMMNLEQETFALSHLAVPKYLSWFCYDLEKDRRW